LPKLEVDGIQLHWEVLGQGEPVAFLNGVLMTTKSWNLQTSVLSRHYRCLLHDFRGQLLSDKPLQPWTMEDHAQDLKALLDHLGVESCHIIGTSYGGEVGLIFASRWPDRVKSLSVISSVSEVAPELDHAVSQWRQAALEAPETLYRIMLPTTFSTDFVESNPKVIRLGEERLRSCPPDFFRAFAQLVDTFRQLDITARLDKIRCPTLVMVGEQDALKLPRYSQIIADRIPGSELVLIPGAGHAVILEKPDEVNAALLEFLEKHRDPVV